MAKALTTKSVEAMKPNLENRLEVADAGLKGLYLIIQKGGAKSWALRYRFAGKPGKLTLGQWPVMGLADARAAAAQAIEAVAMGRDPSALRKANAALLAEAADPKRIERDNLKTVIDTFMKRHAARNRGAADVAAMFRREILPALGERRIQEISKREIIEILDGIVDRGSPITANRLLAHMRTLWTWAKGRDIIIVSPLDGIKPPSPETARERVLTDQEIAWFWKACVEIGQPFGSLFQFMLLTGQRRGEAAGIVGSEVQDGIWTLPAARSKNGDEHTLPLSPHALAILYKAVPTIQNNGHFFSYTGTSALQGFSRAKNRLDVAMADVARWGHDGEKAEKIAAFTLHDLRRTAATGMAGLRFPPHVVEAVLNHRSGTRRGVAGVYNRFEYLEEKREALSAW